MTLSLSPVLHRLTYTLGGLRLALSHYDQEHIVQLGRLWRQLFMMTAADANLSDIQIQFLAEHPPLEESMIVAIVQQDRVQVWRTRTGFYLRCSDASLDLDLAHSCAVGTLGASFWRQPLLDQRDFFLLALLMLLRGYGYYGLHANGVACAERSCLIVGHSGTGKTTLSISLIHAGWQFLADDALLLRQSDPGVQALTLRRSFACTGRTIAHFPELQRVVDAQSALAGSKDVVAVDRLYPDRYVSQMHPDVLLFPQIIDMPYSRLLPLDPTSAMIALLSQSAGIFTDQQHGSDQLTMLSRLLQQARSYQLFLGRDVLEQPDAISKLLKTA